MQSIWISGMYNLYILYGPKSIMFQKLPITPVCFLALLQFFAYYARFYATPVNYASNNTV